MSVFRVKLANNAQGNLDIDPRTQLPYTTSISRQVYAVGPNGTHRLLVDGQTFTDCNYWKQFTTSVVGAENSFIEVVTDDGSPYVAGQISTFSVGDSLTATTSYSANVVDFVGTHGGAAVALVLQNNSGSNNAVVELNGNTDITITVAPGQTIMFNRNEFIVNSMRVKSSASTVDFSYVASIEVVPQS